MLLQGFNYWWGYCVDRALSQGVGSVTRQPIFSQALRQTVVGKYLAPMEPITAVTLNGWKGEGRFQYPIVKAEHLQAVKWLPFLKSLWIYGDLSPDGWSVLGEFRQIRQLHLSTITDDGLSCLARLTSLEELTFTLDPATSPAAMRHVAALPNLRRLRLGLPDLPVRNGISDARSTATESILQQLREIAKSPSIRRLECRFRDNASLLALTEMQSNGEPPLINLFELRIAESYITNAGLANLHQIPNLIHLDVSHSRIDDDALPTLKELPVLRTLYLGGCSQITDRGAPELASMHNLTSLSVADTPMTMKGLIQLADLPRLRRLRIGWMNPVPDELSERLPSRCQLDVR